MLKGACGNADINNLPSFLPLFSPIMPGSPILKFLQLLVVCHLTLVEAILSLSTLGLPAMIIISFTACLVRKALERSSRVKLEQGEEEQIEGSETFRNMV